jgi:hypothetical protein
MPTEPDTVVRDYLAYLADPSSLIDPAKVSKAETAVAKAKDPLDRLHAVAALRKAQTVSDDELVTSFVKAVPAYARENGLVKSDFAAIGVPTAVLERAFSGGPRSTSRRSSNRTSGRRASTQQVRDAILQLSGEFRALDVPVGSAVTVRSTIDALVSEGKLIPTGQARIEGQRGRPSNWYKAK